MNSQDNHYQDNQDNQDNLNKYSKTQMFSFVLFFIVLISALLYLTYFRYTLVSKSIDLKDTTTSALLLSPEIAYGLATVMSV